MEMKVIPEATTTTEQLPARLGWLFGGADFEPLEVAINLPLALYALPFLYDQRIFNVARSYDKMAELQALPWVWGICIYAVLVFHATTGYAQWRLMHLGSILLLFSVYVGLAGLFIGGAGRASPGSLLFIGLALIAAWAFIRDIRRYAYWSVFQGADV